MVSHTRLAGPLLVWERCERVVVLVLVEMRLVQSVVFRK